MTTIMTKSGNNEIKRGTSIQDALDLLVSQGYQIAQPVQELDTSPTLIRPTMEITHKDLSNGRWYHQIGDIDLLNWRPSVTTQLSILDKGPGFNLWNRNLGHMAPRHRDAAAIRGSHVHYWMHALVAGSIVNTNMILNHIIQTNDESWRYFYDKEEQFAHSIRRYLASFCAFWDDKTPTPVAVEYPIYSPELPFAGRLDLLLKFKKAKNSKKESLILVDLKTGAPYPTHAYQNSAYKLGWETEHPELPIDYIAGLYVKDSYRGDPTYTLTYQTYNYDAFLSASHLWHEKSKTKSGNVLPTIKKEPPKEFNLYHKQTTKRSN